MRFRNVLTLLFLVPFALGQSAHALESCPKTIPRDMAPVSDWPDVDTWIGTEGLAVILPHDGYWTTTDPGKQISIKLFWYAEGFEPGMEQDFRVSIERLDEGPNDARVLGPTNAIQPSGVATILTGIGFSSAGCWKVSAEFNQQALDFVVETLPRFRP